MIDIGFSPKVKITKTDLVTPTLSSFLSEVGLKNITLPIAQNETKLQVGGSMGLWLGLGAVQVFQLAVKCLLVASRRFNTVDIHYLNIFE